MQQQSSEVVFLWPDLKTQLEKRHICSHKFRRTHPVAVRIYTLPVVFKNAHNHWNINIRMNFIIIFITVLIINSESRPISQI